MPPFTGRAPLVARELELTMLTARLGVADERRGGLVLVSGEPGIGKTRILASLAAAARAAGWRVLNGTCYESELTAPYLPFTEALKLHDTVCHVVSRWKEPACGEDLFRALALKGHYACISTAWPSDSTETRS